MAFFRDEPGADIVESYIANSQHHCLIHNVNLCEVYYDFFRSDGEAIAESIVSDLRDAEVEFCSDLASAFWKQVGYYRATITKISLADCFALTLAQQKNGILVTSDRREFEPIVKLNICPIEFIR